MAAPQNYADVPPPAYDVEAPAPTSGAAALYPPPPSDEKSPALPPRPSQDNVPDYSDNVSDPANYTRDPHRLIAYLIPFPAPSLPAEKHPEQVPTRFLIYTPPPPPLQEPKEGEKEGRAHKLQRKWQNEVRAAKQSTAKTASWQGVKSKATKGIAWAMNQVKSADLEFLNRVPGTTSSKNASAAERSPRSSTEEPDPHSHDARPEGESTHRTVGLEEMVLVYPSSFSASHSEEQVREEFIGSMMRTKDKAQRDAILATGLLPVSAAIDILATVIWPFGGLLEVDGVWAYASLRGAKTARGVTKRLTSTNANASDTPGSSGAGGGSKEGQLRLTFHPSPRMEILKAYLAAKCSERDVKLFPLKDTGGGLRPTESEVLEAIGWTPGGETKNWEDEQWELEEVKGDLKATLGKGARAWDKWCKRFEKEPEKALKKG